MYDNWIKNYKELISNLPPRPCEVIFLTNHENSMIKANEEAKNYMKYSSEIKNSSGVMRYPIDKKRNAVESIKCFLEKNNFKVRYIF